jgi:hypothetical protein
MLVENGTLTNGIPSADVPSAEGERPDSAPADLALELQERLSIASTNASTGRQQVRFFLKVFFAYKILITFPVVALLNLKLIRVVRTDYLCIYFRLCR